MNSTEACFLNGAVREKAEPILLMSHHDVVEANGKWDHEPFSGDIDGHGNLWGQGTVDTKPACFAFYRCGRTDKGRPLQPERDVYIASLAVRRNSAERARRQRLLI